MISFYLKATVWCDFIVMYLLKKRNVYREHKYQRVDDEIESKRHIQVKVQDFD